MSRKIVTLIMGLGSIGCLFYLDWKIALCVFVVMWVHNLEYHIK